MKAASLIRRWHSRQQKKSDLSRKIRTNAVKWQQGEGEALLPHYSSTLLCTSCHTVLSPFSTKEQEGLLIIKHYRCPCGRRYDIQFARIGIYECSKDVTLMRRCDACALLYPDEEEHCC